MLALIRKFDLSKCSNIFLGMSVGSSPARDSEDSPQLLDFTRFTKECPAFLKTVVACLGILAQTRYFKGFNKVSPRSENGK